MIKIVTLPVSNGSTIEYWAQKSLIGQLILARTEYGVCYLGLGQCFDDLQRRFAHCRLMEIRNSIELCSIDTLHLTGTDFQLSVWRALLQIPRGQTVSYSSIALAIGRPRAVRAVGSAVGANPVSIIVPCHRVVRGDGSLGGYFWGLELKSQILAIEHSPSCSL